MNRNGLNFDVIFITSSDSVFIIEKFFLRSFDEPALQVDARPSPDAVEVVEGGDVVRCR